LSGALTIAIKNLSGGDPSAGSPVTFRFPDNLGGITWINVTAPLNLVVPSGATLGVVGTSRAFRLWIVAFNDAGTVRLGVGRMSTEAPSGNVPMIAPLEDSGLMSSTLISSTANTAGVIYTGQAVTNKPMRILGYAEWGVGGLATLGTWTVTNIVSVIQKTTGGRKPGDVVQTWIVSTGASLTIPNVATYTALKFTAMNLMHPCNPVELHGSVILSIVSGGSGLARVYVGSSAGTSATGVIDCFELVNTSSAIYGSGHVRTMDFPQITANPNFTMGVGALSLDTNNIIFNPGTLPLFATLREIMG
jgi:hypothetical protein